jgi:hypothetical protein
MLQATFWPGPAPVWPALAMALVESECMVMCCHSRPGLTNHDMACSIATSSVSKAVYWLPILRRPSATVGPSPLSSPVIIQPKPTALRKEPSVHGWQLCPIPDYVDVVLSLARGALVSTARPSLIRRFLRPPLASANHRGIRCLLESSVAFGGKRSLFGVPSGAERAAAKRRSLRRSKAGLVGGVSAALIASSPLTVPKVLATLRPIVTDNLWKPSRSHSWPSHMASIP